MSFLDRWRRARTPAQRPFHELLDGYRYTCAFVTAVEMGLIARLERGAARLDELAEDLGARAESLQRFLRALAALRIVAFTEGAYRLDALGRRLARSEDVARLIGAEYLPAWSRLKESVATGEAAFPRVFGRDVWSHRRERPDLGRAFDAFMARIQARTVQGVLSAHDFSRSALVVDVGGGRGLVLEGILKANAGARGILFDLPEVAAQAAPAFAAAGLGERVRAVGGSFFDDVPAGGDVYVLQHVLHDWDDEHCRRILRACRDAMGRDSVLLVVESVAPDDGALAPDLALRDLHMMVMLGGRERTRREYEDLLRSADLAPGRLIATDAGTDVLEARAGTSGAAVR